MDHQEFAELLTALRVHGADHSTCEVKRARGGMPVTLWESISAFANGSGGHLILGVDEKSGFTVVGVDDAAAMEAQIGAVCADMEPPVRAEIQTVRFEEKNVVIGFVPSVPRDQRPCHKRVLGPWAGSRIRVADGDRKLTDYEVAILLSNRTEQHHDLTPVPTATVDDLDPQLLGAFLRRIRATKGPVFGRVDDERALLMLNVLAKDGDRVVPTLAGLLVFGIYPQTFEPQLDVTLVVYPTGEPGASGRFGERFIDNRSLDGPIPEIVAECVDVLKRNMRRRSIISGIYRVDEWEYPEEVIREALVNSLVHRDYSAFARGMQVQVEMYPDRLLIRNAGGLFGTVDVGSLGTRAVTSSRNRALLKILEDTPLRDGRMVCENRGTGIAQMLMALGAAGMEPPRFTDDISTFTVEIPNHALLDEETLRWMTSLGLPPLVRSQMTALALMRNGAVLTNSGYRTSTGVQDSRAATRELKELVDAGVVEQDGNRGSTTYRISRAVLAPIDEPVATPARLTPNERQILAALSTVPLLRADIEDRTGLSRDTVKRGLQSLRQKGFVSMIGQQRSRGARWVQTLGS
ncbi:ATP-dependent DNA helicase RecG [Actinoplanes campanulatus]|uniref:ATP-dependent DNA helicase RecG n=1 Tax=Actinoplanes campanulatus TaxID=113559 RepID=A0A7W5AKI0_9ACTN|nr:ATP-binding protein [Actinoplanes campanulatus]MBB3097549.1 ATP-dependent DNA helicase RecG [Actinoplanes campanulatus]GGN27534.1 dihydroorotate dehydrogenase [Actinoplanes campanulatus]GID37988.1 dihydroorotate dehydrogenase [Actinoplanes campanulatus]